MPETRTHRDELAPLTCPKCQFNQMRRVRRHGWWERDVMAMLGFYPWECMDCRQVSLHKLRKASSSTAESAHPARTTTEQAPPAETMNPPAN